MSRVIASGNILRPPLVAQLQTILAMKATQF